MTVNDNNHLSNTQMSPIIIDFLNTVSEIVKAQDDIIRTLLSGMCHFFYGSDRPRSLRDASVSFVKNDQISRMILLMQLLNAMNESSLRRKIDELHAISDPTPNPDVHPLRNPTPEEIDQVDAVSYQLIEVRCVLEYLREAFLVTFVKQKGQIMRMKPLFEYLNNSDCININEFLTLLEPFDLVSKIYQVSEWVEMNPLDPIDLMFSLPVGRLIPENKIEDILSLLPDMTPQFFDLS